MNDTNYTGSILAIAALVAGLLTKWLGTTVSAQNVVDIVSNIIIVIGIIKQMVDHKKQGATLASVRAGE